MTGFLDGEIFTNFFICDLTYSQNFFKTNQNSNCINETFKCSIDHLCGRHLSDGKLNSGNRDIKRHIDFHIAEPGVCNKPSHQIQFFGVERDSFSMKISLPLRKNEHIILQYQDLLNQSNITFRQMTQIIGCFSSTTITVLPAPLHYRALKCQQILESEEKQSFNPRIMLVSRLVFSLGIHVLFKCQ